MKRLRKVTNSKVNSGIACIAMVSGLSIDEIKERIPCLTMERKMDTYQLYAVLMQLKIDFLPYSIDRIKDGRYYLMITPEGNGGRMVVMDTVTNTVLDPIKPTSAGRGIIKSFHSVIEVFPPDGAFIDEESESEQKSQEKESSLLAARASLLAARNDLRVMCLDVKSSTLIGAKHRRFIYDVVASMVATLGLSNVTQVIDLMCTETGDEFHSDIVFSLNELTSNHVILRRKIITEVVNLGGKPLISEVVLCPLIKRYVTLTMGPLEDVAEIINSVIKSSDPIHVKTLDSYRRLVKLNLVSHY